MENKHQNSLEGVKKEKAICNDRGDENGDSMRRVVFRAILAGISGALFLAGISFILVSVSISPFSIDTTGVVSGLVILGIASYVFWRALT